MTTSSQSWDSDPNVRLDIGGWISGPCLPAPAADGRTPQRMFVRAVLEALSLPAPATPVDEITRLRLLADRARVVATTCRGLLTEADGPDSLALLLAAQSISEGTREYPPDTYSWHPLGS